MKAGILTFSNALNPGAVLQAFSLCSALEEAGHEAALIDYRCPAIEAMHLHYLAQFAISIIRWHTELRMAALEETMEAAKNKLSDTISTVKTRRMTFVLSIVVPFCFVVENSCLFGFEVIFFSLMLSLMGAVSFDVSDSASFPGSGEFLSKL